VGEVACAISNVIDAPFINAEMSHRIGLKFEQWPIVVGAKLASYGSLAGRQLLLRGVRFVLVVNGTWFRSVSDLRTSEARLTRRELSASIRGWK